MAWFNEGLSSLKGQISNLTKEIVVPNLLSDNIQGEEGEIDYKKQLEQIEDRCRNLEQEVEKLKHENSQLRQFEGSLQSSISSPEVATLDCEIPDDDFDDSFQTIGWGDDIWTDSFLGQDGEEVGEKKNKEVKLEDEIANLQKQLSKLLLDKRKLKQRCCHLDSQVEILSEKLAREAKSEESKSKHCQLTQTDEDFSSCITSAEFNKMQQEFAQLREERAHLRSELMSMTQVVQDLESQVRVSQDENANLSTGLEELDIQHQEAIEQMMMVKESTQKRYEALLLEFDAFKMKCNELEDINESLNKTKTETSVQTENNDVEPASEEKIKCSCEENLFRQIENLVPFNIYKEYFSESETENSVLMFISALSKGYQKRVEEKSNCDKKISELNSTLLEVEDELNSLEHENMAAKSTIERLNKKCESLKPIPEHDELESLDLKVNTLEKEVNVLREVRSNLEVELNAARNAVSDLTERLQTKEAMIRNQDNLQNEFSILQASEQSLRDELNALNQVKESVEKENVDLKQKNLNVVDYLNKSAQLEEKFQKNLETEVEKQTQLAQELNSCMEEIKQLKKDILSLNEVCNSKQVKLNDADLIHYNMCNKVSSLKSKCNEMDKVIDSLIIENESKERKMCELILEKSAVEKHLEELKQIHENVDSDVKNLQISCSNKDSEISNLKLELKNLNENYKSSKNNLDVISNENKKLKLTIENVYVELKNNTDEKEELLENIKSYEKKLSSLEKLIMDKDNECISLRQKISSLEHDLQEIELSLKCAEQEKAAAALKYSELDNFQKKCYELESSVNDLQNKLILSEKDKTSELEESLLQKNVEIDSLEKKCSVFETKVKELEGKLNFVEHDKDSAIKKLNLETNQEYENLMQKCSELKNALLEMEHRLNSSELEKQSLHQKLNNVILELNDKSNCLQKINKQLKCTEDLKTNLESKHLKLKEQLEVFERNSENYEKSKEKHEIALESVSKLSQTIADNEKENVELKQKCRALQNNLDQQLPKLLDERDQLISSLQAKHMEGLEYHNEIQRLNRLLSEELNKTTALTSDVSIVNKNCLDLRQQIEEKEETIKKQDREIVNLKQQVETLQSQLEYASQLLRVADRQEAEGQPSTESTDLAVTSGLTEQDKAYIASLERERSELAENLLKEQTRNKYLQNEVQEHHEKEMSLAKEVERLRSHLVSVEDNYTQEMIRAEEQVKDLHQRLSQADERVKNSSTAYTSASIRANQQVETLQAQARLLLEQRDKIQSQLSASEDKIQKQAAALTNLQIVLEQFQRDKEKDIALETERIKQNLQQEHHKSETLRDEVKSLQAQLREAKEALNAASRLGEQLERKDQAINDLKEEVKQLTEKMLKMEEKLKATSNGGEGKVDRYLVKNLLVGYLSAPPQSRMQALRVLATVVDLSHEDRQRVGLEPASSSDTSQLPSLSEAFVRFLENESRPQHPLRLPLGEASEPKSRRSSTSVLLPDVLPNIPQYTAGRNFGSILKDVLKDDRL